MLIYKSINESLQKCYKRRTTGFFAWCVCYMQLAVSRGAGPFDCIVETDNVVILIT